MPDFSRPTTTGNLTGILLATAKIISRQVKFPTFFRALTESLFFCGVFLAAGHISLGLDVKDMLVPMVPVVLVMMLSMVFSGVYRPEITNSIMNLYIHSAYGFVLGSIMFCITTQVFLPEYATLKFQFFFLFFSFFVTNTMRPIISGTDFMDGGGRRTN